MKTNCKANFDNRADTYGVVFGEFESRHIAEYEKRRILEEFNDYRDCRVLDIGCGWGRYDKELVKKEMEVVGIDISKKMLKVGRERLKSTVSFILSDANALPFKNNTFDIVLCVRSLKWLSYDKKCLNEINRVLKKKGQLIIYDERNKYTLQYPTHIILNKLFDKYPLFPPYISIFHLKRFLSDLGFSEFKIEGLFYIPLRFYAKVDNPASFKTLTTIERIVAKILPKALLACTFIFKCQKCR